MGFGNFLADITGGLLDAKSQRRTSNRNVRYQREFAQNAIQWRTDDAIAAGVHPLFAMGAQTTSFQPGIPQSGSAAGDAVRRIAGNPGNRQRQQLENDLIREQIKTSQWRRQVDRSNVTQDNVAGGITVPGINTRAQEIDKGKVQPHKTNTPEVNLSQISPMTTVLMGDQRILVPVEDMETVIEDPVTVAAATFFYKGNKNVKWGKVGNAYFGMTKMAPWKRKFISELARLWAKKRKNTAPKNFFGSKIPTPRRR